MITHFESQNEIEQFILLWSSFGDDLLCPIYRFQYVPDLVGDAWFGDDT